MVVELYLGKFIIYSLLAFILGYIAVYQTILYGEHIDNGKDKGPFFDFFYVVKKIGLFGLVDFLWKGVVKFVLFITGFSLVLDPEFLPKDK